MPTSFPLSRHHTDRIDRYCTRLEAMVASLDALPDRRLPLTRAHAGRFRRTIQDGRALLGLAPATHLDTTRQGVEFFLESILIRHRVRALNALHNKAVSSGRPTRYPPPA